MQAGGSSHAEDRGFLTAGEGGGILGIHLWGVKLLIVFMGEG